MVMPQTVALLRSTFPREEFGMAVGAWGGVSSVSIAGGPLVTGRRGAGSKLGLGKRRNDRDLCSRCPHTCPLRHRRKPGEEPAHSAEPVQGRRRQCRRSRLRRKFLRDPRRDFPADPIPDELITAAIDSCSRSGEPSAAL
ncbi:MFS transporter [Mycetocola manganoxydans]